MRKMIWVFLSVAATLGSSQTTSGSSPGGNGAPPTPSLHILDTILIDDPQKRLVIGRLSCDGDGNVYFLSPSEDQLKGVTINKLDVSARKLIEMGASGMGEPGVWRPSTALLALQDGSVYSLMYLLKPKERGDVYIVHFGKNGDVDSKGKLESKGTVQRVAPFGNGDLLVDGRTEGKEKTEGPLTVIVSKSGKVIHDVNLDEDNRIRQVLKDADSNAPDPANMPTKALDFGLMEPGADGLVYLMRYATPYVIYGIGADGTIIHRISVDAPKGAPYLRSMHVVEGRIALLFGAGQPGPPRIMKIIASGTGDEIAKYEVKDVGAAFACYSQGEKFVFLSHREKQLVVQVTSP